MVLDRPGTPLRLTDRPEPVAGPGQVLLRVRACGVCRTDLHVSDGAVAPTRSPLVLGHQIVAERVDTAERIGVPWLGWTDGSCRYCAAGQENLCEQARFTGKDLDGGFAEWTVADERFCLPLPDGLDDVHAAPLLCAGLIGLRTLRAAGDPARVGLYGFGAAAHLVCQIAVWEGREVYAFTRPGDTRGQAFARDQGAIWAGGSDEPPDGRPASLDAALIFAPAGDLVPLALLAVRPGGVVVCGGIHMSDIPSFPYADLWQERVLRSVANLTRADGHELLALAPLVPLRPHVTTYPLHRTQHALDDLRSGALEGAAVVVP
ncbi:MAG: zinc-dependent alcohol dehydrogenase family protein [Conexibacter sp.]|nr:zinc-dependent alcohol dehydrogenase family protein [Conexibacter sp.]